MKAVISRLLLAGPLVCLALAPQPAASAPANTLRELWDGLHKCLASARISDGAAVTVVFALRRDGTLLGKPNLTYAKFSDDAPTKRRDAEAIVSAFDRCLPASITDALGAAIAGRPLAVRLVGRKKSTDI